MDHFKYSDIFTERFNSNIVETSTKDGLFEIYLLKDATVILWQGINKRPMGLNALE